MSEMPHEVRYLLDILKLRIDECYQIIHQCQQDIERIEQQYKIGKREGD